MNGYSPQESYGPQQAYGGGRRLGINLLPLILTLLFVGFTAFRGCHEGPFGRRQLRGIDQNQEMQLGLQAFQEVISSSDVVRTGPAADAVKQITRRLVQAVHNPEFLRVTKLKKAPPFDWDVRLVRSKEVNAFCLPGGKMVVYTGILPVAETDSGLATVMGHEISHALAHHGAERMAQSRMAQILVSGAGMSVTGMDDSQQAQLMQVLNAGAKFGILKYNRKHESEADHLGLILMAAAGYDPRQSVRFWERMQAITARGGQPPEFLSTHPSHETRIHDLMQWIPEAMPLYQANRVASADQALPPSR